MLSDLVSFLFFFFFTIEYSNAVSQFTSEVIFPRHVHPCSTKVNQKKVKILSIRARGYLLHGSNPFFYPFLSQEAPSPGGPKSD